MVPHAHERQEFLYRLCRVCSIVRIKGWELCHCVDKSIIKVVALGIASECGAQFGAVAHAVEYVPQVLLALLVVEKRCVNSRLAESRQDIAARLVAGIGPVAHIVPAIWKFCAFALGLLHVEVFCEQVSFLDVCTVVEPVEEARATLLVGQQFGGHVDVVDRSPFAVHTRSVYA